MEPTPLPPAKVSVFVFEDDFPLNGEQEPAAASTFLAPNEPGLGGFNITLFDDVGGTGDAAGQMTYDMFNMPLSNAWREPSIRSPGRMPARFPRIRDRHRRAMALSGDGSQRASPA